MEVDELSRELEDLGVQEFQARYGRYFLVLTGNDTVDNFASFVMTATRSSSDFFAARRFDDADIRPIVPSQAGRERVSVGREGDVDITIPDRRISKLHAYFTTTGGLLSLVDANSKNGTRVNGAALPSEQPVPVDVGDTIEFGSIGGTIWGFDDLLAAIKSSHG